MSQIQVRLSRYDAQPWGFRLQGGTDFGTPLVVQKVRLCLLYEIKRNSRLEPTTMTSG